MRELTHSIAIDRAAWTPERAPQIASLFDSFASGWRERDVRERHEALVDSLARGGSFASGWCVEIGSGMGNATADRLVLSESAVAALVPAVPGSDVAGHSMRDQRRARHPTDPPGVG